MFKKFASIIKPNSAVANSAKVLASQLPELGRVAVTRVMSHSDSPRRWPWITAAAAAGLATGAGVALLLAPSSGARARRLIKQKALEVTGRATEETAALSGSTSDPGDTETFNDMTKKELYEEARAQEIPGRSAMDKQELVDSLHG